MSLQLKLTKTSTSSDCLTLIFGDTTGNYDVSINPGGYGAPNQARVTLNLLVLVNLRKSTGREPVVVPSYTKTTGASWTVSLNEDGWYEMYAFGCLAWGSGITYQLGYITYDLGTDTYYKSLQASNTNHAVSDASWWIATTDVDDFTIARALSQPDTYDVTLNEVEKCRSTKCWAKIFKKAGCCECEDACKLKDFTKVDLKLKACTVAEAERDYSGAQELIENLQLLCEDNDCGCGCS